MGRILLVQQAVPVAAGLQTVLLEHQSCMPPEVEAVVAQAALVAALVVALGPVLEPERQGQRIQALAAVGLVALQRTFHRLAARAAPVA